MDYTPPKIWLPPRPAILHASAVPAPAEVRALQRRATFPFPIFVPTLPSGGVGNDSYTKLLMHFDGSNGSTTMTNSAAGGTSVATATGGPALSTSQSKFGASSLRMSGAGYVYLDGSSDYAFGTGDFTVDLWLRLDAMANGLRGIFTTGIASAETNTVGLYIVASSGVYNVYYRTNNAYRISGSVSLSTATWYHVALVRASGSTKLYINGTQDGSTYTDSNNYINNTNRPLLGIGANGANPLTGYMDEVRVSKGVARWTTAFAPPTAAYA